MKKNTEDKKANGQENEKVGERTLMRVTEKSLFQRQKSMALGGAACRK